MTIAAPRVPSWQHPATCPGEAAPDTRPEPEHLGHGGPEAGQCEQCRHHQHSERSHHARILNPFFRFIHRFSGEYILQHLYSTHSRKIFQHCPKIFDNVDILHPAQSVLTLGSDSRFQVPRVSTFENYDNRHASREKTYQH